MRPLLRVTVVVLLLFLLAACGGEDSGEGETAATEPQTAADDVGSTATGAEAEPSGGEEAGVDDQTAAAGEVDAGDNDAIDEAAGESDSSSSGEETSGELETGEAADEAPDEADANEAASEESAAEEVEVSAGKWGESGTGAQSACDHPYLPLREGATWTYEAEDDSFTWEVTTVEGDLQDATAVVLVTLDETVLEYTWNCKAGEGISSFDFASQGLTSAFPEMTVEIAKAEGEFLPPAEQMVPGFAWTSTYTQEVNMAMGEGDASVEIAGDMDTVQNSTIVSDNPITAAGVTVDGVQVEQISEITMALDMMGTAVEQTMELTNLFELGWGVGIMRQEVQVDLSPTTVELISFFVP